MLQIKNISKQYKTGDLVQNALKDVSLNFRDNEFVSILGPSGSGKTTFLNIIGGLDRYDKGDLIINNVSTKKYKDRDWDSYRNHTVGFVFQSYNLIPHQTILANVEIALTISGISKKQRRKKALEALNKVGLKEQAHKKPNQMSGGQMQRVAIARALVNNPDILLADEPTGALDTETSFQVMGLLKQVADDRLVVMVTHNPELAEDYSTRIVKLKDGQIVDDSNPFNPNKEKLEKPKHRNLGKSSMSFLTALSLSLRNLLTKKGRTILTAFAGSIGIIGIALILSLSTGFQNYIDQIQEDTLTSYPLTITKETADASAILLSMINNDKDKDYKKDEVIESQVIRDMFSKIGQNDLTSLNNYIMKNQSKVNEMVSLIQYKYSIEPLIYSKNNKKLIQLNPSTISSNLTGNTNTMMSSRMTIFNEMIDDKEKVLDNYKILAGRWIEHYNEVILILPDAHSMSDLLAYSLGLRDQEELSEMITALMKNEKINTDGKPLTLTYDELMNIPLKLINPASIYKYNYKYNIYEDMSEDNNYMNNVYNNSLDLKIVGIVTAKEKNSATGLTTGIGYSNELIKYIIGEAAKSEIVKKQLKNEEINVFNNKRFDDKSSNSGINFKDMISIDKNKLSQAFGIKITEKDISDMTQGYMKEISDTITTDTTRAQKAFSDTLNTISKNMLHDYINNNKENGIATLKLSELNSIVDNYLKSSSVQNLLKDLETNYTIPKEAFLSTYSEIIKGFLKTYILTISQDTENPSIPLIDETIDPLIDAFVNSEAIVNTSKTMGAKMTEANMQKIILSKVGELTTKLIKTMSMAFSVDETKFADAFKFNLGENEIKRLMDSMKSQSQTETAGTNLIKLGYQNLDDPTSISFYFKNFDAKEEFIKFLDDYNKKMEKTDENKVIKYSDITGILMSSVKTIVNAVSYVLIAFVSISLVVSSIMIGIITYISVLERTKEIGILRAIGASKRNISSIFNAETFIIGLFSGAIGI